MPEARAITFFIEPHISVPTMSLVHLSFMYEFSSAFFTIHPVFSFCVASDKPIGFLVIISLANDGPDMTAKFFVDIFSATIW